MTHNLKGKKIKEFNEPQMIVKTDRQTNNSSCGCGCGCITKQAN